MSQSESVKKQVRGPKAPPALDPRAPSLVQPFKRLVDEGFIKKIVVTFTPSGFEAVGEPDERMVKVKDSGLVLGQNYPLGTLSATADLGNLIPLKGKAGKKTTVGQPKPAKTLTSEDFDGGDQELLGRARAVATACGGATLVGRVRSSGAFGGEVTTSFKDWWQSADPLQRASSLVIPSKLKGLTRTQVGRLAKLECPFRGDAEFVVSHDEEPHET